MEGRRGSVADNSVVIQDYQQGLKDRKLHNNGCNFVDLSCFLEWGFLEQVRFRVVNYDIFGTSFAIAVAWVLNAVGGYYHRIAKFWNEKGRTGTSIDSRQHCLYITFKLAANWSFPYFTFFGTGYRIYILLWQTPKSNKYLTSSFLVQTRAKSSDR